MKRTNAASQLFAFRAPSAYNKLPLNISGSASLLQFRRFLEKVYREFKIALSVANILCTATITI